MKYRNHSLHPLNVVAGKASPMVGPGEFVTLNKDDEENPHNASMIHDGDLKPVEEAKAKEK